MRSWVREEEREENSNRIRVNISREKVKDN